MVVADVMIEMTADDHDLVHVHPEDDIQEVEVDLQDVEEVDHEAEADRLMAKKENEALVLEDNRGADLILQVLPDAMEETIVEAPVEAVLEYLSLYVPCFNRRFYT